jgi:hypothetical protein
MKTPKDKLATLPEELQLHVEHARRGLAGGASGPQRVRGLESLEALVSALIGARGRAEAALTALHAAERKRR